MTKNLTYSSIDVSISMCREFPAESPTGNKPRSESYLSPAPQAEPQAAGVSSGLSPAPQAADVSSGLSPTPQAVPQAAGAAFACFHPNRLKSAILVTSIESFFELFCSLYFLFYRRFLSPQVRTFLLPSHLVVTNGLCRLFQEQV